VFGRHVSKGTSSRSGTIWRSKSRAQLPEIAKIALSDPHGPFQSTFFTNQEEQSHRQNAIT